MMVALVYVLLVLFIAVPDVVLGFQPQKQIIVPVTPSQPPTAAAACVRRRAAGTSYLLLYPQQAIYSTARAGTRGTRRMNMNMVFDFLRKRSEEGLAQVQNIATKTIQGKFSEALSDSAAYIKTRQAIDAESLQRLTGGLARSRERLLLGISGAFTDDSLDLKAKLEMIEGVLLQADIGGSTTSAIIADLEEYARTERLQEEDIIPVLRERLIEALTLKKKDSSSSSSATAVEYSSSGLRLSSNPSEPTVLFVIGANGMGKTTTIGKIASRLRSEGNATVLLGACDTFRAAAVEQLGEWARRANVSIEIPTAEERGGDPVPVVTRSIRRAVAEKFDFVIIDTSGRLSNNFELIEQLQGMKAAIQKELPQAPHETLLVVDGSVGRNAVDQANAWRKYVGVSGLVITKLDGTARGGFVVSVVKDLGLPVKFIGVGEKIDDLRDFQPEIFVDALLGNNAKDTAELKLRASRIFNLKTSPAASSSSSSSARGAIETDSTSRLQQSFLKSSSSREGVGDADDDGGGGEPKKKAKKSASKPTKAGSGAKKKKKKTS